MSINLRNARFYGMKGIMWLKSHGPAIATYLGVGSMAAGTVVACKETMHLEETLKIGEQRLEAVHQDEKASKKDILKARAENALDLAKLYGPAAALTIGGGASILWGHGKLNGMYIATAAAYKGLDKTFRTYRNRVIEEFGKEAEEKLRHAVGHKGDTFQQWKTDENGNEVIDKEEVLEKDKPIGLYSQYARCFDEYNPNWENDPEANRAFLMRAQSFFNNRLRIYGVVLLNDVYEYLGFKRSKSGAIVGWRLKDPGDFVEHYIDFGLVNDTENARMFANGYEPSFWLDFNVDGIVLDDLDKPEPKVMW